MYRSGPNRVGPPNVGGKVDWDGWRECSDVTSFAIGDPLKNVRIGPTRALGDTVCFQTFFFPSVMNAISSLESHFCIYSPLILLPFPRGCLQKNCNLHQHPQTPGQKCSDPIDLPQNLGINLFGLPNRPPPIFRGPIGLMFGHLDHWPRDFYGRERFGAAEAAPVTNLQMEMIRSSLPFWRNHSSHADFANSLFRSTTIVERSQTSDPSPAATTSYGSNR